MKVNSFIESFSIIKIDDMIHNLSMMTDIENRAQLTEIFRSKKVNEDINPEKDKSSNKKCISIINLIRRKCSFKRKPCYFDMPKH